MEPLKPREAFIFVDGARLRADLYHPARREGLIVFVRGDDYSRDERDQVVAHALHEAGFATLHCDLWTAGERAAAKPAVAPQEVVHRLQIASNWAETHEALRGVPLGYFGADAWAAAVLRTAGAGLSPARAIVSLSGRLDLVPRETLARVHAPTLLLVGARDPELEILNRNAANELRCIHRIAVVPGASRLFDERTALERVARHACRWFEGHLLSHSYRPPIAEEASVE